MMLLECPLLVSPILDSLLAVHITIYTIVGVQATLLFEFVIFFSGVVSKIAFVKNNKYLISHSIRVKLVLSIICDAHDF